MDFLALKDISERTMRLVNPTSPEKLLRAGELMNLQQRSRVIDFGAGFGELLALWSRRFGVSGVGIDVRPYACARARERLRELDLSERCEIVCGDAANYAFEPHAYDVASCVGASFIWGGYRAALAQMRQAIRPGGRLLLGEPYWRAAAVPPEFAREQTAVHTELELLTMTHAAGFELSYVLHSSTEEWDRYECDNWQGLLQWLQENPDHPEREEVQRHLYESQAEYLGFGREFLGWALYILQPRGLA